MPSVKGQDKDCWGNYISWLFDFYKILRLSSVHRRLTLWLRKKWCSQKSIFIKGRCNDHSIFTLPCAVVFAFLTPVLHFPSSIYCMCFHKYTSGLSLLYNINSRSETPNDSILDSNFPGGHQHWSPSDHLPAWGSMELTSKWPPHEYITRIFLIASAILGKVC